MNFITHVNDPAVFWGPCSFMTAHPVSYTVGRIRDITQVGRLAGSAKYVFKE